MNKSHPLAEYGGNEIKITDLEGESLIVPSRKVFIDTIYRWFREVGAEPRIVCEMDSYLDAAALAGKMVGISIFPRTAYIPNDYLVFRELEGEDKTIEYLFVWRKGHPLPSIEEYFIDFVKELVEEYYE
jgi:DNA-binding transcriptional LysR family regulator